MKLNGEKYSLLIDTNAMVSLSLFKECCNCVNCELTISLDELKKKFEQKQILKDYLEFEEIQKGWAFFNFLIILNDKYDYNVDLFFSLLSDFEIKKVIFETVYHREMTKKSIPYRIQKKDPFSLQFNFDYEKEVVEYWEKMKEKLENHDIELIYPDEESSIMRDTLEKVSRIVSNNIALSSQDLYLYSLAIMIRADSIYSLDGKFVKVINKINTENSCKPKRDGITKSLISSIPSFAFEYEQSQKIALPFGMSCKKEEISNKLLKTQFESSWSTFADRICLNNNLN